MNRISVDSSNINSIGYDEEEQILEIEFDNGIYHYFNVPSQIYQSFLIANSHGKYFHENIKNVYDYKKAL